MTPHVIHFNQISVFSTLKTSITVLMTKGQLLCVFGDRPLDSRMNFWHVRNSGRPTQALMQSKQNHEQIL